MRDSRDKKENLAPKRPAPKKGKRKFVIAAHDFLPRVRESFNAVSPLVHTWGHVLEDLPTIFLLWFLWLAGQLFRRKVALDISIKPSWRGFVKSRKAPVAGHVGFNPESEVLRLVGLALRKWRAS